MNGMPKNCRLRRYAEGPHPLDDPWVVPRVDGVEFRRHATTAYIARIKLARRTGVHRCGKGTLIEKDRAAMRKFFQSGKQAISEFVADDCLTSGAALAYYSIFALPPLVILVFLVVNSAGVSQQTINDAIRSRLGIPTSSQQLQSLSERQAGDNIAQGSEQQNPQPSEGEGEKQDSSLGTVAEQRTPDLLAGIGVVGKAVGLGILLFTATGLFAQLQRSLNRVWGVEPDPDGVA